MNSNLNRSHKVQLLFSDFTHVSLKSFIVGIKPELCEFYLQESINKTSSPNTYNRWINGETAGKRFDHSFFQLPPVKAYLSEALVDKKEIVEEAHALLMQYFRAINPNYKRKTTVELLQKKYESLLSMSPDIQHSFTLVKNVVNPHLPYYAERLQPEFLALHIDILTNELGTEQKEIITSKLLRVSHPNNGEQYTYPVIELLPKEVTLELNENLSHTQNKPVPADFLDAVRESKHKIFDAPTFAIDSISYETGEMKCKTSSYFQALFHCDKHYLNIVGGFPGLQSDKLIDYLNRTEIQNWAQHLKTLVIDNDFSQGEFSLGSSCLFIYNTKNGYQTLLAKKARSANGFNDMHVLPASMFQPVLNNPLKFSDELNFKDQVIRELAEEIFNYPELTGSHSNNYLKELYGYPEIKSLEALFDSKEAEFHITGLSLDMFRLRPEILSTIIIHDSNWAEQFFPEHKKLGNWEIIENGIIALDLNDESFYEVCAANLFDPLCAPGIACFVNGYLKYKDILITRDKSSQ